jgi:hypothetical protein
VLESFGEKVEVQESTKEKSSKNELTDLIEIKENLKF